MGRQVQAFDELVCLCDKLSKYSVASRSYGARLEGHWSKVIVLPRYKLLTGDVECGRSNDVGSRLTARRRHRSNDESRVASDNIIRDRTGHTGIDKPI